MLGLLNVVHFNIASSNRQMFLVLIRLTNMAFLALILLLSDVYLLTYLVLLAGVRLLEWSRLADLLSKLLTLLSQLMLLTLRLPMLDALDRHSLALSNFRPLWLLRALDTKLSVFFPLCIQLVDLTLSRKNVSASKLPADVTMLVRAFFMLAVDVNGIIVAKGNVDLIWVKMATVERYTELVLIVLDLRANLLLLLSLHGALWLLLGKLRARVLVLTEWVAEAALERGAISLSLAISDRSRRRVHPVERIEDVAVALIGQR